jgi:hypothetical protein
MAKLVGEDAAVEPDGDGLHDIRYRDEVFVRHHGLPVECLLDGKNDKRHLVSNCNTCHDCSYPHDYDSMDRHCSNANNPNLEAERNHDQDSDDERKDVRGDEDREVLMLDMSIVSG